MKKILYIASAAKKHICHFHLPYIKWFKEKGCIVHAAAGDDFEEGEKKDIPYSDRFYRLPISRSPFRFGNIKAYRYLKKLIRENRYDLICCNTPVGAALGRLAARKARKKTGTKVAYISHGFHFYEGCPKIYMLYYLIEKFLVPYTDAVVTINKEDYRVAVKLCANRKHRTKVYYVHGMGVDTKKYVSCTCSREKIREMLGIPQEATVLVSVSEINRNKNLAVTIKALAHLCSDMKPSAKTELYYIICGIGEELAANRELAKELGIADRVRFLGYRHDIEIILHAADIFLFPSIREGLGMAPIEAMSAGLPVIASDIRGVREYAVDGYNSILIKDPMDVKGFAKAVRSLCDEKSVRQKMGKNAAESVKNFDLEYSMKAFAQIFGGLL